jgi:hypothetical protein
MQLHSKNTDNSTNVIDLRKARNVNEIIVILGRINTTLRLQQRNMSNKKELSVQYAILSWAIDAIDELDVALTVSQSLADVKRERCVRVIRTLHREVLELRKTLMTNIHTKCLPMVDTVTDDYISNITDTLSKRSRATSLWVYFKDNALVCILTFQDFENSSGFISPLLYVKLEKSESGSYYVSVPTSPFSASSQFAITKSTLMPILKALLNFDKFKKPRVRQSKLLKLSGVKSIDTVDPYLNVHLHTNITDIELTNVLKVTIPSIRKAVLSEPFEVLHEIAPDRSKIIFSLGQRSVTDAIALSRLIRTFGLNKTQVSALNDMLEKK